MRKISNVEGYVFYSMLVGNNGNNEPEVTYSEGKIHGLNVAARDES